MNKLLQIAVANCIGLFFAGLLLGDETRPTPDGLRPTVDAAGGRIDPARFDRFPEKRFSDYRKRNRFPVLSLPPDPNDPTVDSPFPPSPRRQDLDRRDPKTRYLRGPLPPDTRQDVFYDHPRVQSRPFRPMHIRYCADVGTTRAALDAADADGQPDAQRRDFWWQRHPRQQYMPPAKQQQPAPGLDRVSDAPLRTPRRKPEPPKHRGYKYQPQRLFTTLPELGTDPRGLLLTTFIDTPPAIYPEVNPFRRPPGTNMLPTIYENMRDRVGNEMVNTLPSLPNRPYNLHDGQPIVRRLQTQNSPTDDLRYILDTMFEALTERPVRSLWESLDRTTIESVFDSVSEEDHIKRIEKHRDLLLHHAEWAVDILAGNDGTVHENGRTRPSRIAGNRAYKGFGLLHHSGHRRVSRVKPVYDENGTIVAGNVDVHQLWFDGRIESDTMFYDFGWDDVPLRVRKSDGRVEVRWFRPTDPNWDLSLWEFVRTKRAIREQFLDRLGLQATPGPLPHDVPWTVTFTLDVLNRGEDDFSPSAVYFDRHEEIDLDPVDEEGVFAEVPWGKMNLRGENVPMRFGPPHIAMDGTFFPLQEGTRTVLELKMAPTGYQNVHYTWGWRKHPPRAQAVENLHKRIPPRGDEFIQHYKVLELDRSFVDCNEQGLVPAPPPRFLRLRIDDHERFVFEGVDYHDEGAIAKIVERYLEEEMVARPRKKDETREQHEARIRASLTDGFKTLFERVPFLHPVKGPDDDDYPESGPLSRIGDLAPAKRMWRAFRSIQNTVRQRGSSLPDCLYAVIDARDAFLDWKDRNRLPSGLQPDPKSDLTMLFVNNTLYGQMKDGALTTFDKWTNRGADLKIALLNGDYFLHGYAQADFGSLRGWENQFKPTLSLGGQGSMFTFGRFNWRFNVVGGAVPVPPAIMQEKNPETGELEDVVEENTAPTGLSPFGEPIYDGRQPEAVRVGAHRIWVRLNFEPSRRLRFYQFDPLHHDAAIYSVH